MSLYTNSVTDETITSAIKDLAERIDRMEATVRESMYRRGRGVKTPVERIVDVLQASTKPLKGREIAVAADMAIGNVRGTLYAHPERFRAVACGPHRVKWVLQDEGKTA